jgi:hypothetical protein
MDEKIKALWVNNRILFFLLLPLIAVYFLRNWIISLLVDSGNKLVSDTTKKSDALKQEETVANTQAEQIKAQADAAPATTPVADEDWNKKK